MSDVVIRAEGLGKRYLIGHETERESYVVLRDVLARSARRFVKSASDMMRGRQLVVGNEIEEFWAFKDVDFEIRRGEVVGVIGRNGAGKSTLLKVLSRITEPTTGRVEIRGRVASLLEVGTGFHPELTGRENIFLNGAILGMTRVEIKRKFDEIVAFAEVEKFLDTPVKRYSSGMYVRLAFAVAAHLEPEILIVDEVLAVGDAEFQKKCLGKMKDVAGHGRTVLFVSHNMAAIRKLCSRAALFERGRLIIDGNVETSLTQYLSNAPLNSESFENHPRNYPSDPRIRLIGLRQKTGVVLQDGEVEFAITVRILSPVRDVAFGIGFGDAEGSRILTVDSDHAGHSVFSFAQPGNYAVHVRIPQLHLAAAEYTLDVGCRTGVNMLDSVAMVRTITVEISDTSNINHAKGYRTALVRGDWDSEARSDCV